jgi:hypothetical protein
MSPNASLSCACGRAVVNVVKGVGVCSFCGRTYAVEATWTPRPAPPKPQPAHA